MRVEFKITLDSHHNNHANSKLTILRNYSQFGNEARYIIEIMKELSVTYARLINQYKFKHRTVFSARFDKQREDNQLLDETELYTNLNNNFNLTETDLDNIDVRSPIEHQMQQQEMKTSGWKFDKINSMTVYFYKMGVMNGRSYVKFPEIKRYLEY